MLVLASSASPVKKPCKAIAVDIPAVGVCPHGPGTLSLNRYVHSVKQKRQEASMNPQVITDFTA